MHLHMQGIIPWDDDGDIEIPDRHKPKIQSDAFRADLEQRGMRLIKHNFGFKIDYNGDPQIKSFSYNCMYPEKALFQDMSAPT